MKGRKWSLCVVLLLCAVLLGGCGEEMYELTEEEEYIIADYAAHVVAKHNSRQAKGLVALIEEPEEAVTEKIVEQESSGDSDEPEASETSDDNTDETQESAVELVSLQEALQVEDVAVVYERAQLQDSYIEGDYFALDASAGKKLLVLYFSLENEGETDVVFDMLSRSAAFTVSVDGADPVKSDLTILPSDLSSYQGNIAAGTQTDAVLLFQIPETENVDSILLTITQNGEARTVAL
ncbi:MAG: hypothetical protein IJ567_08270 [Lachnospiraceae bacterium]|nr:hypothetical protein [Lachnospiraceae bacterium]